MTVISLSTATTAVSRKIRDESENEQEGDLEARTTDLVRWERRKSRLSCSNLTGPATCSLSRNKSRSDSALLLLMLVSYALSIIRRTTAHYADVSHGERVANEEDSPQIMCFFFLIF